MPKQLRELADVNYGQSPSGVLDQDGCIPVVGTGGTYATANRSLFSPPAIVVPRKGSLGNPQLMEQQFWAVDTTYAVIPKPGIDAAWLYYNLDRYDLTRLNEATGVPSISRDWLYRISFHDPGPDAQKKIGVVLRSIDDAIERTESLIAKYQQIKAGMMHDLFTRGLDSNGQLRPPREEAPELYKDSPLGWIPKEWDVTTLANCADVDRGKFTARPRDDPKYYGGQDPFIQTGDVAASIGRILTSYSQTLSKRGRLVSKSFPTGTIMVTIAANIADTCILGIPMFAPDSLVGAVPKPGQIPRFLELCIRVRKQFLSSRAPQSAQKNINLEDLRPLTIPKPSPEEQVVISTRYDALDAALQSLENERVKLSHLKSGIMNDLLTGRVRVKVDDSVGEPAHV